MKSKNTKRVFVAIDLTDEMKSSLRGLIEQYLEAGIRGRYERAYNLHITLAFIGETSRVEEIKDAISKIEFDPFVIETTDIGRFETRNTHNNVLWMGMSGESELAKLACSVRNALDAIGIEYSATPFKAHITLARGDIAANFHWPPTRMTVDKISLMETSCSNGHRKYITL